MQFLTPDKTYTKYGLVIKEKILPVRLKPNRLLASGKAEYVTIHNTPDINEATGTNDAEQYARATHNGNMGDVSVHYYLDETDCWHILNDNEMGYHAADGKNGKGNTTSLAIEIIMNGSGSKNDIESENRGALLAAILLYENGLDIDRLTTHNRWYEKKYCPAYILPHWEKFVTKVKTNLEILKQKNQDDDKSSTDASINILYVLQAGAFLSKTSAENMKSTLTKSGFEATIKQEEKYYKVNVGSFANKQNALAYQKELSSKGITTVIKTQSSTNKKSTVIKGDVDGNGKVTAADARIVLRASVGLETLTEEQKNAADYNSDGKVDAADARDIMKASVGG